MTMIKFPNQIKPDRLTVNLQRVQETIGSPVTNIYQVAARGNPMWRWTIEYRDLSDSERDIVHAFLMKCKGSVNTFKIKDPGNYENKSATSEWIDIFSGTGQPFTGVGSTASKINSYFGHSSDVQPYVTDDGILQMRWQNVVQVGDNVNWSGHGLPLGRVASLEVNAAYVQRVKHFQNPDSVAHQFHMRVSSGTSAEYLAAGPSLVSSTGVVTLPFYSGFDVSSITMAIVESGSGASNDTFGYADYHLERCALVSNAENIATESNNFSNGAWSKVRASVDSGVVEDARGGNNGWRLHVNSDAATGTHNIKSAQYTKSTERDWYTVSIYVRDGNANSKLRAGLRDTDGNNSYCIFDPVTGVIDVTTYTGQFDGSFAKIHTAANSWSRIQLTAYSSSLNNIYSEIYVVNSDDSGSYITTDTSYVEIYGAQVRQFPFMGQYTETGATVIVGSGWQTGSYLYADGFEPDVVVGKAGQRLEIVNRFHTSSETERSEFKRLTEDVKSTTEGWALLKIDPPIRNAPQVARSFEVGDHDGVTMHNPIMFRSPELQARLMAGTIQYIDKPLKTTDIVFDVIEDLTE